MTWIVPTSPPASAESAALVRPVSSARTEGCPRNRRGRSPGRRRGRPGIGRGDWRIAPAAGVSATSTGRIRDAGRRPRRRVVGEVKPLVPQPARVRDGSHRDHLEAGGRRETTERGASEVVKVIRDVPVDPAVAEHPPSVAAGVRRRHDGRPTGAKDRRDPGKDLPRVRGVLDHLIEGDIVEAPRIVVRGIEQPDASVQPVSLGDPEEVGVGVDPMSVAAAGGVIGERLTEPAIRCRGPGRRAEPSERPMPARPRARRRIHGPPSAA